MKYRIKKHVHSYLKTIYDGNGQHHAEKLVEVWYQASRKGKIFGFWHKIGHEYFGWDGDLEAYKTKTLEEIEDYIYQWHDVNYGNTCKCEIIKDIAI